MIALPRTGGSLLVTGNYSYTNNNLNAARWLACTGAHVLSGAQPNPLATPIWYGTGSEAMVQDASKSSSNTWNWTTSIFCYDRLATSIEFIISRAVSALPLCSAPMRNGHLPYLPPRFCYLTE